MTNNVLVDRETLEEIELSSNRHGVYGWAEKDAMIEAKEIALKHADKELIEFHEELMREIDGYTDSLFVKASGYDDLLMRIRDTAVAINLNKILNEVNKKWLLRT